jgi:hypothetical protein
MFFPSLKYTVVHFHNPQWSTGRKQPKLGEHSGPLGRNSYYSVENFFVSAQNRDCFSAIMHDPNIYQSINESLVNQLVLIN